MANTGVPPKQTPMVFTWAVRVCGVTAVRSAEKSTPAKTSQSIIKSELQRAYFHFNIKNHSKIYINDFKEMQFFPMAP